MANVHYEIVEHDGGFAYKVDGVYSETFRTHEDAHDAAMKVAAEQERAGDDTMIEYQGKDGKWRVESAKGSDRPHPDVDD